MNELLLTEDQAYERAREYLALFERTPDALSPDEQALVMTINRLVRVIEALDADTLPHLH
jgi:hypothetical protein